MVSTKLQIIVRTYPHHMSQKQMILYHPQKYHPKTKIKERQITALFIFCTKYPFPLLYSEELRNSRQERWTERGISWPMGRSEVRRRSPTPWLSHTLCMVA